MEFVTHDQTGKLSASSRQKIRRSVMQIYRRKERESQQLVSTDSSHTDSSDTKRRKRPMTQNRKGRQKEKPFESSDSGLARIPPAPYFLTESKDTFDNMETMLLFNLFGDFYSAMTPFDVDRNLVAKGISIAWEAAPSQLLLAALLLKSYGTLVALNHDLPIDLALRYKAKILKELHIRAESRASIETTPTLLALMCLASYEQSILSSEAPVHLSAVRRIVNARGGKQQITHCQHVYVMLDVSDIIMSTWTDARPTLNDIGDVAYGPASLAIHFSALATAVIAEVYSIKDPGLASHRARLRRLPRILLQAQSCLDTLIDREVMDEDESRDFIEQLEAFKVHACTPLDSDCSEDNSTYVARACYQALVIVYHLSLKGTMMESPSASTYVQQLLKQLVPVDMETWQRLPFLTHFIFLIAGTVCQERKKMAHFKAILNRVIYNLPPAEWFKIRDFVRDYYHLVQSFRTLSHPHSVDQAKHPGAFAGATTTSKPSRIHTQPSRTYDTHGASKKVSIHPKLELRLKQDKIFYDIGERNGHWQDLNERLGHILALEA